MLAIDVVRYQGEPVALVAADHPETARQAAKKIVVEYDVLEPVVDAVAGAASRTARGCTRAATWSGTSRSAPATRTRPPTSSCPATTEVGMQDQAFLGPESGLAVPDGTGGRRPLRRHPVAARRPAPGLLGPRPRHRTGSGCSSPGSAARSAAARTCRCTCTAACSRCTPASR